MFDLKKTFYMGLTAFSGLLNIAIVLFFVKKLDINQSDLFLLSLGFVNFFMVLISSPMNTAKVRYLLSLDGTDEIKNTLSFNLYLFSLRYIPYLFLIILVLSFSLVFSLQFTFHYSKLIYASTLTIYVLSCVFFELTKVEYQINRNFIKFSYLNVSMNIIVFTLVIFCDLDLISFFIIGTLIRSVIIFNYIYMVNNTRKEYHESEHSISVHFYKLINTIKVYSFSVFFTALSGFLPNYLLSFFQPGYVTAYQLAYRFIMSPLALLITPYVDYVRYNLKSPGIEIKNYLRHLLSILFLTTSICLFIIFISDEISNYFLESNETKEIFEFTLKTFTFVMITSAIYIFNTRMAELKYSISIMSVIGLLIHIFYLILITFSTYNYNYNYFVFSKLFVELCLFIPISFYFLKSSNVIK